MRTSLRRSSLGALMMTVVVVDFAVLASFLFSLSLQPQKPPRRLSSSSSFIISSSMTISITDAARPIRLSCIGGVEFNDLFPK